MKMFRYLTIGLFIYRRYTEHHRFRWKKYPTEVEDFGRYSLTWGLSESIKKLHLPRRIIACNPFTRFVSISAHVFNNSTYYSWSNFSSVLNIFYVFKRQQGFVNYQLRLVNLSREWEDLSISLKDFIRGSQS